MIRNGGRSVPARIFLNSLDNLGGNGDPYGGSVCFLSSYSQVLEGGLEIFEGPSPFGLSSPGGMMSLVSYRVALCPLVS